MAAYSMDLRRKVVAAVGRGETAVSVAQRFEISTKTVGRWLQRQRDDRLEPESTGRKNPVKLAPADDQTLRQALQQRPGLTLRELRALLSVEVVESTICRRLQKLELTLKKSR